MGYVNAGKAILKGVLIGYAAVLVMNGVVVIGNEAVKFVKCKIDNEFEKAKIKKGLEDGTVIEVCGEYFELVKEPYIKRV